MTTSNNDRKLVKIQVVLEYQWTASRDLINDVQAQIVPSSENREANLTDDNKKDEKLVSDSVSLASIIESLSKKGFDLEDDQRVSYRDPAKSLYCYIGKASDEETIASYRLPKSAFAVEDGQSVLTLLIREASSGLSGSKKPVLMS